MLMKQQEKSLEWVLKHLTKYYDSDFFPRQPEFEAIRHDWDSVKTDLLDLDLEQHSAKSPAINLAPKKGDQFRVVHQLTLIDAIIYTGLIYEIAEQVEEFRVPVSEQIAFSYRISPQSTGSLFSMETGWSDFKKRKRALADEYSDGYVLVADITDFYNQIYTHRIKNLIDEATNGQFEKYATFHLQVVERNRATGVGRLLMQNTTVRVGERRSPNGKAGARSLQEGAT